MDNIEALLPLLEHGELDFAVIEGVYDKVNIPTGSASGSAWGICSASYPYESISRCRDNQATSQVEDMQNTGEFNLVYINQAVAEPNVTLFLGKRS